MNPCKTTNKVELNETEKKNVSLLSGREKELKELRKSLLNQLVDLKRLVLANDTATLRSKFGWFPDISSESVSWMVPTLSLVQPDQIHFYKHDGLYQVAVDNGYSVTYHSISIKGERVLVNQNVATHSEIIPDFDEYTEYRSEMVESYMGWEFKYEQGVLKFVRELFAG